MNKYLLFLLIFISIGTSWLSAQRACLQQAELDALGRSSRPEKDTFAISPSGHFFVHYDITGSEAPDITDNDANGIPDYVDEVGIIADSAHHVLVDIMEWEEEPFDGEGGYDIYIMSYAADDYGFNSKDIPSLHPSRQTSYLQIDNDYLGYNSIFNLTPIQIMRISLGHEYFHGIQWGYEGNLDSNAYFFEMTSMWFEDVLIPDANDYLDGWADDLLNNPTADFDNTGNGYELALFGHYLSSFIDPKGVDTAKNSSIIREMWEWYGSTNYNAFSSVAYVLENSYNISFIEAWVDFISRNLYNGMYEDIDNPFYYYGDQSLIDPITTNLVLLYDSQDFVLDLDNKSVAIQSYQLGDLNVLLDINHSFDEYLGRISIVSASGNNDIFWGIDTSGLALLSGNEIHFIYGSENQGESLGVNLDINIDGCTDPEACNYNSDATHDDENCEYPDSENYPGCDCEGNVLDECGVCNGSGIADGKCDCDGNVFDCMDVCGGSAVTDCAGECGGSAEADDCGVCNGDSSSCTYSVVQSQEQAFYYFDNLILDGEFLEDGDWLLAYNNGILVGAAPWNGPQTEILVMGEEQFELEGMTCDSGPVNTCGMMLPGETPQFSVFKAGVGEIIAFYTAADGTQLQTIPAWIGNGQYTNLSLSLVNDCNTDMGGAAVNSGLCGDCWGGNTGNAEDYMDTDNDGVCNDGAANGDNDNCPDTPNTDQTNNDGDEDGDLCDADDDDDGCPDDLDDASFEWDDDYDNDGTPDDCDSDDDNDGSLDPDDSDDNDEFSCSDLEYDTCDDCSTGYYDIYNDGADFDGDGICDSGDGILGAEAWFNFENSTENTIDIHYRCGVDITGIQFTVTGVNLLSATHDSMTVDNYNNVIVFNFIGIDGFPLDACLLGGCTVVSLLFSAEINGSAMSLSGLVVGSTDGTEITTYGPGTTDIVACTNYDGDDFCDIDLDDDDDDDEVIDSEDCDPLNEFAYKFDCGGICGGDEELDECGVCGGSGIADGACDCAGNVDDCAGICGGTAAVDECGACGGNITDVTQCDCLDGAAMDCNDVCGGDAVEDECGVCGGNGSPENYDCDGECTTDIDCNGECGGNAVEDECGICNGDNLTCTGCMNDTACNYDIDATISGECEYAAENYDCNGNCIVEMDCTGECGGTTELDTCDNCGGDCEDDGTGFIICSTVDVNANNLSIADVCGECNGIGIVEGTCDCDGNTPTDLYGSDDYDCDGIQLSLFNGLIPEDFSIYSIYPNPFNPVTNIIYGLPEHVNVQIVVYDLSGKKVATLINQFQTPGYHAVDWDADNLPSGVYLIRMDSGDFIQIQKVVLVK